MNYTLHQLQVFIAVAELKSITRAAEALHLTQPAISIQLKNFQQQFPIALYEVVGKRLHITEFGEEVWQISKSILAESEMLKKSIYKYQGEVTGTLKLSIVSTGKYIMPYLLKDFLKKHPAVELKMDVTNKEQVIESLENNEVDFSLVSIPPKRMKLNEIELIPNLLFLVAGNAFRSKRKLEVLKEIENLPLIFREYGSGTRQTIESFLKANNLSIKNTMQLTSNEAVKQAVLAGLGVSIMPLIGIKNELNNGELHIIESENLPLKSMWQLVWLKQKRFSSAAQSFLDYLEKHKTKIIDEQFGWYKSISN